MAGVKYILKSPVKILSNLGVVNVTLSVPDYRLTTFLGVLCAQFAQNALRKAVEKYRVSLSVENYLFYTRHFGT